MNCDPSAELLSAFIDGEIGSADREELEVHMAGCEGCRSRFGSLRALKHAVARLEGREGPPGAVRARVENLRFERDQLGAAAELAPINIKSVIAKDEFHVPSPRAGGTRRFS